MVPGGEELMAGQPGGGRNEAPQKELFEIVIISSRGFATLLLRSRASPVWYSRAHIVAR